MLDFYVLFIIFILEILDLVISVSFRVDLIITNCVLLFYCEQTKIEYDE